MNFLTCYLPPSFVLCSFLTLYLIIFSKILNFALFDLEFSSCSSSVAIIGFLFIIFPSDFAPHTQYGKSLGHVHFPCAST